MSSLTRRTFLKLVGGVGASFALGTFTVACASPRGADAEALPDKGESFAPTVFLKIDPDGTCTMTISRSDMGQGVRTTFAMLVAEELDADWSKVKVTQAPGNSDVYGGQGTGGSSSTRTMNKTLRQVGAATRAMLVAAAAQQWKVDPSACKTEKGKVLGPSGQTLSYGELTTAAKAIPVPDLKSMKLKDRADYKIIGKATNRVDNTDVVTGKAMFGLDVHVDGMLYAACLRPPSFHGQSQQIDDSAARKVPGVVDVVPISSGVAVIGTNTWACLKGRDALKVDWSNANSGVSSETLRAALKQAVIEHKEMSGAKTLEANFELPYLAHATMEPLNAVADVRADSAEVWSGSQSPDGARDQIAEATGLSPEKVTMHTMILGGGFGRKFSNEWIGEAVNLSKHMKKPVKLLWTRECDMQHDIYRSMSEHALKAAIDAQGNPVGWSHQYLQAPGGGGGGGNYGNRTYLPYDFDNAFMRFGGISAPVPTGPWRSVEHTQIIVANECFVDEIAHAAGQDPFEFRRKHIKGDRLRKVLEMAAEKGNWGKPLPQGSGRGIACFDGYGSCIAHVVEVTVKGNQVKVDRMVAVVDVGTAINPRGVEAQVQGAFVDGISTSLKAAITVEKGGAVQNNWDGYEWARMTDVPKMEVYVADSGGGFGGMGEVGYPSGPPAIANAIFAATGKRVRKFPIKVEELV
ncbi:MAG TPA: molybdopterin cofactor-binding domain-containing protein [Fimbriimonadaceae bacterium]|nr:molybdopterin cofactor-binding domain-containing protein [Fimbriimonadaceae bacterium]